jgi:hypothetical protein
MTIDPMSEHAETLRRGQLYPLADRLPPEIQAQVRSRRRMVQLPSLGYIGAGNPVRARWTGEKRPPRAGEWYLSGAVIEAYRAPNDLSTPFHIAELVETEEVTTTRVVQVLAP